ncbi:MAG TPA: ABC transporter ATP-binding protein [Candidatus Acidoferrum sp.]|nr:ABC transporter ATP-binding protein [Candidatus Acidoferrum sp.]
MNMLKVSDLQVSYGAIHAVKGVSLEVNKGEIVTLIGANGAGKTTILHSISGLKKRAAGEITLENTDLTKVEPHKILRMGLAHVPEGRRVFAAMTVAENLEMGAYTRADRENISSSIENVYKRFPRLGERRRQLAGTLSGGEQQMLAIGRALMSSPRILLLDEPSMGLSPILVKEIFSIIREVNESGVTVLLIEQNAKMALSIADRGYVLETGKIALSGKADELLENEDVRRAYLGQ